MAANRDKVVELTAAVSTRKVGPNMILKVSAGDVISAASSYFYFTNDATGPSINTSDVLTPLIGALLAGKGSAVTKVNGSAIQTNLSIPASDFASFIGNQVNNGSPTAPKAFLNILFFDEQFNFIPLDPNTPSIGTNLQRVSQANDQSADPLLLTQKAPKNGWVYIYLSNERNQSVYFDNLQVSQEHGCIAEENHYYAFGQKIAGICTKAFNKLPPNSFNYQGDYSEEEENTLWNEFDLRMYDPQIGRWTGADPYDEFASPYVGMGNDPVNNVDPSGGGINGGTGLWGTPFGWGLIAGAASAIVEGLAGGDKAQGATAFLAGFAGGFGAYYINWSGVVGSTGNAIGSAGKWIGSNIGKVFNDDGWLPFYKSDLIRYANSDDENTLGQVFENIFDMTYRLENPITSVTSDFRRNEDTWRDALDKNSKPDFTSDAEFWQYTISDGGLHTKYYHIIQADAFEVKQSLRKGIYEKSYDLQIWAHMNNLAAKQAEYIAMGFEPTFTLVTTYDVKNTGSLERMAKRFKMRFSHLRIKYKKVDGMYRFKTVPLSIAEHILRKLFN